jgi:hypothetical protein
LYGVPTAPVIEASAGAVAAMFPSAQSNATRFFHKRRYFQPGGTSGPRLRSPRRVTRLGERRRFLQQYEVSNFDYTKERDQILPDWDVETMIRKANERKAHIKQ